MFRSAFIKISCVGSYSDWALNLTLGLILKIKYKKKSVRHRNPSLPFYQNSAQLYLAEHLWFVNEATKSFLVSK